MVFKNNLDLLDPPESIEFKIPGVKFPTNQDVYFRAKQRELADQYASARVMMYETESKDWNHWLNPKAKLSQVELVAYKARYCAVFYESALFFYNAVVSILHGFSAMFVRSFPFYRKVRELSFQE